MADRPTLPKMHFWMHQLLEYLFGVLMISQGFQAPSPIAPVGAGLVMLLLAATSDGPLAASKLLSRPLHRWFDVAAMVGLVAVAVVFWSDMGVLSAVTLILSAGVVVVLLLRTDYRAKVRRPRLTQRLGVDDLTGSSTGTGSEQVGRIAGRLAGRAARTARNAKNTRRN